MLGEKTLKISTFCCSGGGHFPLPRDHFHNKIVYFHHNMFVMQLKYTNKIMKTYVLIKTDNIYCRYNVL